MIVGRWVGWESQNGRRSEPPHPVLSRVLNLWTVAPLGGHMSDILHIRFTIVAKLQL